MTPASSHDWQASPTPVLLSISHSLPSRMLSCRALLLSRFYLGLVGCFLARLTVALVSGLVWLLQDDDDDDQAASPDLCSDAPAELSELPAAAKSLSGFDKRALLQPHFGQTFKVKRVGAL